MAESNLDYVGHEAHLVHTLVCCLYNNSWSWLVTYYRHIFKYLYRFYINIYFLETSGFKCGEILQCLPSTVIVLLKQTRESPLMITVIWEISLHNKACLTIDWLLYFVCVYVCGWMCVCACFFPFQLSTIDFSANIDITKIRQLKLDDIRRSYFFVSLLMLWIWCYV